MNRIDHGSIHKVASEAGGDHSESHAPLDSPGAQGKPRASIQRQKRESQVKQQTQNPRFVKELEIRRMNRVLQQQLRLAGADSERAFESRLQRLLLVQKAVGIV